MLNIFNVQVEVLVKIMLLSFMIVWQYNIILSRKPNINKKGALIASCFVWWLGVPTHMIAQMLKRTYPEHKK